MTRFRVGIFYLTFTQKLEKFFKLLKDKTNFKIKKKEKSPILEILENGGPPPSTSYLIFKNI